MKSTNYKSLLYAYFCIILSLTWAQRIPSAPCSQTSFFFFSDYWSEVRLSPLVRRPLIGLLYQPRMIYDEYMEQSVEWELAEETEVLGENLSQCHFVQHKSRMTWPGMESRPTLWEVWPLKHTSSLNMRPSFAPIQNKYWIRYYETQQKEFLQNFQVTLLRQSNFWSAPTYVHVTERARLHAELAPGESCCSRNLAALRSLSNSKMSRFGDEFPFHLIHCQAESLEDTAHLAASFPAGHIGY
jgi:hypothetical protein